MPIRARQLLAASFQVLCVLWAGTRPALAQSGRPEGPPVAQAVKVAVPPIVDGDVLTDDAWSRVTPITEFWQTSPDAGQPSSERTEVRIVYTGDTIYFGVVMHDRSPEGLTVSESRRDSPLDDVDSFRIILDTYHDRQNGFVFGTNPAALEYDGQVSNEGGTGGASAGGGNRQQGGSGGGFNLNWDGVWQVRTTSSATGWSAEFAIPFRTLRYEPGAHEWGLNFQRTIRRRKEIAYWAPLPIQFDLLRVSLAGALVGLDLPAQRNLQLIPYALGERRQRAASGPGAKTFGDVGLDVKYSVTPSLTLDGTINTDFAQVEVDEQQVNLDRFTLFFPEKRPFFLENAGLFAVGSPGEAEVFFSRRIGIADDGTAIPIVGGARLSGRAGPVNIGFLNMQTDGVGEEVAANNFTVARVQRDFRGRSNVGAIFVGRVATGDLAGADDHNATVALDGRWGIGQSGLISGFVARSSTPGMTSSQHAYQVRAQHDTQPITLTATYTETGRHFNPEVGFLSRPNGFRKLEGSAFSRLRPQRWAAFQEIRPHSLYRAFWNHDGFQETGYWHIDSHWELQNSSEFHTGMNVTHEGVVEAFEIFPGVVVPPGAYDHAEAQLVYQSNQGAPVYGRVQFNAGGFFGGDRVAVRPEVRIRAGETFSAELGLERNSVDLPGGSFVTNLARTRVSYSFSPRVFVQSLVQYNDRANSWSSNFRFGWLQAANTGLFVVYTDSHAIDDISIVPRVADRSLIVKISRMFDALD